MTEIRRGSNCFPDSPIDCPLCELPTFAEALNAKPQAEFLQEAKAPTLEIEIDFHDEKDESGPNGMDLYGAEAIYIENDEVRIVDGRIAQVVDLADIKFMRIALR